VPQCGTPVLGLIAVRVCIGLLASPFVNRMLRARAQEDVGGSAWRSPSERARNRSQNGATVVTEEVMSGRVTNAAQLGGQRPRDGAGLGQVVHDCVLHCAHGYLVRLLAKAFSHRDDRAVCEGASLTAGVRVSSGLVPSIWLDGWALHFASVSVRGSRASAFAVSATNIDSLLPESFSTCV